MRAKLILGLTGMILAGVAVAERPAADARGAQLAAEVSQKGWIAYGARGESGTWDLFLCRPDGSQRRNITRTADFEEGAPRFSPDGRKLLFRRSAKGTSINHDRWGFQGQLMVANADGSDPQPLGEEGELPWGVWSPDGKQISCLTMKGIQIVDLATKAVVRQLPRKGIYQQTFWSPDGRWFCGVANMGVSWTVARMSVETGEINAVHRFQSCTPDWFPDSKRIIYSSRPAGQKGYGWTQLWMSDGDGSNAALIYGEDGRHIYGGALSPDAAYVLLARGPADGGGSESSGAPLCLMRMADAPTIAGPSEALRTVHPRTKDGPVLTFAEGWEPHWTYSEVGGKP
jgi:Tol biopolymer transport system component